MRREMIAYREACYAAKCDRCRKSADEHGWDEWCGGCMDRIPDFPRLKSRMGKAASELYTFLKLNGDRDVTIQECTSHLGVNLSRAWQLYDQLANRGMVEQCGDIVWAWDGEKPYMGATTRD